MLQLHWQEDWVYLFEVVADYAHQNFDAQAAYESANTLQTAALAGVNFMLHTAGWLEGGLAMGYEKFVMDSDQARHD